MSTAIVSDILIRLRGLQKDTSRLFPRGIFPSYRYHQLLSYKRADDNVYFTSFILIILKKIFPKLKDEEQALASLIITEGELGISNYKSRLGDPVYNFYRSEGYFPNGKVLSKFKTFQPTDDADDTAIAYRGKKHSRDQALAARSLLLSKANGQKDIWNKRFLKKYRTSKVYNTWIGSENLYVDIDICVIANVLSFMAEYKLPITEIDKASISLIESVIMSGDYIQKKHKVAAWYPFNPVIFYQISELLEKSYFKVSNQTHNRLIQDIRKELSISQDVMSKIFIEISLRNLGEDTDVVSGQLTKKDLDWFIAETGKFSYGVIPLLHPFRGNIFQRLSTSKIFHLVFDCEAQRLTLLLQNFASQRKHL